METSKANTKIDAQQISLIEDALKDNIYQVKFKKIPKKCKKYEKITVLYEEDPTYSPKSSDWIGLFPAEWINPFHYITFEWADIEQKNGGLRKIVFDLDKFALPKDSKYQFLYITNDDSVIGASALFELVEKSEVAREESEIEDYITETNVSGSQGSLATKSESSGSFELVEAADECSDTESTSGIGSTIQEIFTDQPTLAPVKTSSDHITLTESYVPTGESIYNWLRDLEDRESKTNEGKEIRNSTTKMRKIEEIVGDNIQSENMCVPYPSSCLENLKTIHCSQLQLATLSSELSEDLGKISSCQMDSLADKCRLQLNPEVSTTVMLGGSANFCHCENEKRDLKVEKSRLQKRLKNACANKRHLNAAFKDIQEVSEFRKMLLERLTDLLKNVQNERDSLQVANNMLSQKIGSMQKTAVVKKNDLVRLSTSASMVPKLMDQISSLNGQVNSLVKIKETHSERLPQLERENEKLRKELTDFKKQHTELQDLYEDILHSLFDSGVAGLVRKNDDGNLTVVTTGKNTDPFSVKPSGVQTGEGRVLELQSWRNVTDRRSSKHLRAIERRQERIESLTLEISELQEKLGKELKTSSELRKNLKFIQNENHNIKEKLAEQEGINTVLCETITLQSKGLMPQPLEISSMCKSSNENCGAGVAHNYLEALSKSTKVNKSTKCNASTNTVTKISKSCLDAATNTPVVRTVSVSTDTSSDLSQESAVSESKQGTTTPETSIFSLIGNDPPPRKEKFTHATQALSYLGEYIPLPGCNLTLDSELNSSLQLVPYVGNQTGTFEEEDELFPILCPSPFSLLPTTEIQAKYDMEELCDRWDRSNHGNSSNENFSANPDFNNNHQLSSNESDDIINWGIDAMASFADKCEAEIKKLYNYFDRLMKTELEKNRSNKEKKIQYNEEITPRRRELNELPSTSSTICQIEDEEELSKIEECYCNIIDEIYCDYDFD